MMGPWPNLSKQKQQKPKTIEEWLPLAEAALESYPGDEEARALLFHYLELANYDMSYKYVGHGTGAVRQAILKEGPDEDSTVWEKRRTKIVAMGTTVAKARLGAIRNFFAYETKKRQIKEEEDASDDN